MDGLYLFNKPIGITSAHFIARIKRILNAVKVGHAGTLDPRAEGLLIVAVGREYTKQLATLLKGTTKEYRAQIILGSDSTTYDSEGELVKHAIRQWPTKEEIERTLEKLKQQKEQMPPIFSALKIQGEPAYKMARKGKEVLLSPRTIHSEEIELEKIESGESEMRVTVRLVVSSGFYVRSFAHDLGKELNTGGYLAQLTRTQIGIFSLKQALQEEDLAHKPEAHITIHGQVRGVGYREYTLKTAQKWSVNGFVANNEDLTVQITAQGSMGSLKGFIQDLRTGPPQATAERTEVLVQKPLIQYEDFQIH